ncbi:MAG: hypothetical protein ACOYEV_14465, partial [Candidatus Nanopelagicales bacterium]
MTTIEVPFVRDSQGGVWLLPAQRVIVPGLIGPAELDPQAREAVHAAVNAELAQRDLVGVGLVECAVEKSAEGSAAESAESAES